MYAYEVLLVLNGLEPIDTDGLEFAVITHGYTEVVGTGRARGRIVRLPEERFEPFEPGEVLVLNQDGREPFGEGRKPGKHSVTYETVASLVAAVELRRRVLDRVNGMAEPDAATG